MPFAVSCRSCGARFSVADDLYQKRFAGRIVTVRCKHCQATIRLDASEPPAKPPKPKPDRRPKWVPKPAPPPPRPPHVRAAELAAAAKVEPAKAHPTKVAQEEIDPEDLFKTPPPSAPPPGTAEQLEPSVDLNEYARSEPPSSETPALSELAHGASRRRAPETHEDMEFLLGLSGSPRTAAALVSPALPTFEAPNADPGGLAEEDEATRTHARPLKDRTAENLLDAEPDDDSPETKAPAKELVVALPVPSVPVAPTPLEGSSPTATPSDAPSPKRRWPAVLVVLGLGAIGGALGLFAYGVRIPPEPVRSSASEAHPPEPEPAAIQPNTGTAMTASATEGANAPNSKEPSAAPASSSAAAREIEPKPSVAAAPAPTSAPAPKPANAPLSNDTRARPPVAPRAEKAARAVEPEALTPTARADTESAPAPPPPQYEVKNQVATEPFDRAAAAAALSSAAQEASACRKDGDPTGTASATVTFAPSGRVTTATLSGPPFAGTQTGSCIAASLRRARVPAFVGDKVTVGKTVVIR
jgi:predicted Zn finger-like uncharacterized protein